MPVPRIPKYRRHASRDRSKVSAFVEIGGRRIYLRGDYDSPESRQHYAEIVHDLSTVKAAAESPPPAIADDQLPLGVILSLWIKELDRLGLKSEWYRARSIVAAIGKAHGEAPAARFGPKALQETREQMVAAGWGRSYVNDQVQRLRRMFKWAVAEEMVPVATLHALQAVGGLKKGRSVAPESEPVLPAPPTSVAAAILHASPTVAAMIAVQMWTGMRSHHLCSMRPVDIDFTSHAGAWVYTPLHHEKGNAKELKIVIGPRSQWAIQRIGLLEVADDEAFLFSPRRACAEWGRTPSVRVRDAYDPNSYRQAVHRACDRARAPRFKPHQLRHTMGTRVRRVGGLETAQAVLGHDNIKVTEIYAEKDLGAALAVVQEIG